MGQAMVKIDPNYLEIIRTALDKTGLPKPFVQEVELLSCNIAGTTFSDLEDIEPELKKHQLLVLKREPKNEYDDNAILILTEEGQKLGYVPQEAFLFSEPYRDNIAFGADEELSDERLAELIERAAMDEEVAEFPGGVDQMIGERGVTLSGGQRQRTCIARALAKDPPVLVLDDCLSAVDTETEVRLLGQLRAAGEGRTVVVAAHRLSSVRNAEQIIVLDATGRVAARGTHAQLTERDGWYKDTWERQQLREELEEL